MHTNVNSLAPSRTALLLIPLRMYTKAHAAIRKDPSRPAKAEKEVTTKRFGAKKLTYAERKAKVQKTKDEFLAQIEAQRD